MWNQNTASVLNLDHTGKWERGIKDGANRFENERRIIDFEPVY